MSKLQPGQPIGAELSRLADDMPFIHITDLGQIVDRFDDRELDQVLFWLDGWRNAVRNERKKRKHGVRK